MVRDGLSRRQAAARFGVGVSTAIAWVARFRADRQRGARADGRPPAEEADRAPGATGWLERCRERDFTLRGLVAELGERGMKVDYRTVWEFVHAEKLTSQKKTLIAAERERPDVARRRRSGAAYQGRIDPSRLVFIDETWTKTNMAPLRGWAPRGQRLKANVPHGHWKTMTFLAALRHDRVEAPWLLDGPINGESFRLYVERVLVADPPPGRHRRHGQPRLAQGQGRPPRHPCRRRPALLPAEVLARPQPDRDALRQAQALAAQGRRPNPDAVCDAIGHILDTVTAENAPTTHRRRL